MEHPGAQVLDHSCWYELSSAQVGLVLPLYLITPIDFISDTILPVCQCADYPDTYVFKLSWVINYVNSVHRLLILLIWKLHKCERGLIYFKIIFYNLHIACIWQLGNPRGKPSFMYWHLHTLDLSTSAICPLVTTALKFKLNLLLGWKKSESETCLYF